MLNDKFVQEVIDQKGLSEAIWFCDIVSRLNGETYNELKTNPHINPEDIQEFDYLRYWWEKKAEELKNIKS